MATTRTHPILLLSSSLLLRFLLLILLSSNIIGPATSDSEIGEPAPLHCDNAAKLKAAYKPKGVEDLIRPYPSNVYETTEAGVKRGLICLYDIFGMQHVSVSNVTNNKQLVDILYETYKFHIFMPDIFDGHPWPLDKWPVDAADEATFNEFLGNRTWEKDVKPALEAILARAKSPFGIPKGEMGIFGFGWGADYALKAAQEMSDELRGAVLVDPMMSNNKGPAEANSVKIPTYIIASGRNKVTTILQPMADILMSNFSQSGFQSFDDVPEGFAGNGKVADWDDPVIAGRAEDVIDILGTFFGSLLHYKP